MAEQFDVDDISPAVAEMAMSWPMIESLLGGTASMRAAGTTYLPQWPKESDDSYKTRLSTATLFPAFPHTCAVMAAKPFARSIAIDETTVPETVRALFDDIDMMGTDLQPFCADLMLKAMQHGIVGVLVDAPKADGLRTLAQEKAAGARPYLTVYPAGSILGWKCERRGKDFSLTQIRLLEEYTEADGEWGEKTGKQVRVLTPGKWEIWRKAIVNGKEVWSISDEGVTTIDVVPFVFVYGLRKGFGIGAPPLLDLAFLNVEHWQSSSDQQTILHVARVPILFARGFGEGDSLTIGASTAAMAQNEKAELKFVEHTGAAIEAGRDSIKDLEDRMRQAGAELLVQRAAIATATQVQSEDEGNRSTLQKIAEDFDESLGAIVALMGRWMGDKALSPQLAVYKDFGSANLTEKAGDLLLRGNRAGVVSSETTFKMLQRMDVVTSDASWDDEQKLLAKERLTQAREAAEAAKLMAAATPTKAQFAET